MKPRTFCASSALIMACAICIAQPALAQDHAADAVYGEEAMAPARATLAAEHGENSRFELMFDMLETRIGKGADSIYWDATASWGDDIDRLELKSAGEAVLGRGVEYSDNQLLWSHAVGPWADLKLGARLDAGPGDDLAHAAAGIAATLPYEIESEAMAFVSEKGDLTGHFKFEHDMHVTQKLVLRPMLQLDLSAQDSAEEGIGRGLACMTAGLRLRYEIAPEFAPYAGLEWSRAMNGTARYARAAGDSPESTRLVAGIRFWF